MRRRIEAGIVMLGLCVMACIILGLLIVLFQTARAKPLSPHTPASYELEKAPVTDWQPDISHCFDDSETRELWDCIRHEDVTRLVTQENER